MDKIKNSLIKLAGYRVYIDTNIFIYFLDGKEPFFSTVSPFFDMVLNGEVIGYTGEAVIAETMVQPYKLGNIASIERFKSFFYQEDFLTIQAHDSKAFDFASKIAGTKGMKLVDSLHIATALQAGCDYFITHDKGIKPMEGIEIIQLANFT